MSEANGGPKLIESRGRGWYKVAGESVRGADNAIQVAYTHALNQLSETLIRSSFARQHGITYGGDRDIYQFGGYPRNLAYQHFADLYDRDPIASRIVDMPPQTTWRNPPDITEPDQEEGTEFTEAWEELVKRVGMWRLLERADRLSRIGRYSVILIGAPVGTSGELARPLDRVAEGEGILFLSAFSEKHAKVRKFVEDPSDARYGLPEIYDLTLSRGAANFQARTVPVHHSRLMHIADDLLEEDTFGREALRPIFNDLVDYQKIATSTAEAYWQRVAGILQAKIDKEANVSDKQIEALDDELEALYHNLRRTFYGKGMELSRLAESEPNPSNAADLYMTRIASGAGIPKRMIFGSETGERASEQDQQSYLGGIRERQQQHAEPSVLRALVDRLVELTALPRPGEAGYEVVWPELSEEPEKDVAEANRARAQAAKDLTPMGGDPIEIVEIDEKRNVWLRPTGARGALTEADLTPEEPDLTPPPEAEEEPEPEQEPVA